MEHNCPKCGLFGFQVGGRCPDCDEDGDSYPERPPLLKGGQGRSAGQLRSDANWLTILALVCIGGLVLAKVLAS